MQLEAVALEDLHLPHHTLNRLLKHRRQREAKHRQTAVLLPILGKPPLDAIAYFVETDLVLSLHRGRRDQTGNQPGNERHD